MSILVLAALLAPAGDEPLPVIRPGDVIEGVIEDGDAVVVTEKLGQGAFAEAPVVGRSFRAELDAPGTYYFDLKAYTFDAYLVLLREDGSLLTEDDSGGIFSHSRVYFSIKAAGMATVQACALYGGRGAFELSLHRGDPPQLSYEERLRATVAEVELRVKAIEDIAGPDSVPVAESLNILGGYLVVSGRAAEAGPLLERALDILETANGPDHISLSPGLNNLAAIKVDLGEVNGGLELWQRCLAIREAHLGPDDPAVAEVLINIGTKLWTKKGEVAAAREHLERALAIVEQTQGPDDTAVATVLNNLAVLMFRDQGEWLAARPLFERALKIVEANLDPSHPAVASTINNFATLLLQLEDFDGAQPLFERKLQLQEAAYRSDDERLVPTLLEMALVARELGELDDALAYARRALDIAEGEHGPEHSSVADALHSLSLTLRELGDDEAAKSLLDRALAIESSAGEEDKFQVATNLFALANQFEREGSLLPALRHAEQALELYERSQGAGYPMTARVHRFLAELLMEGGDVAPAREHLDEALATLRTALGPKHPDTAACRETLATLLGDQGEVDEAVRLMTEVVADYAEQLGEQHVRTIEAGLALAALHHRRGDLETARELYASALSVQADRLPPDHADLQSARREFVNVLDELGEADEAARLRQSLVPDASYPPVLVVLEPSRSDVTVEERRLDIEVLVTDFVGIADVTIEQDGETTSVAARPGRLRLDETGREARLTHRVRIPFGSDQTMVVLRAVNRRGQTSAPRTVTVRYEPPQRDLYLLALGVADYDDDSLDLAFPTKDVDDLIARLQAEQGRFYGTVHVERLVDDGVDTGAVRRLRGEFLLQAQPEDTLVVFAAGHGVRTPVGEYYFLSPGDTPEDPYGGIDRDTLESLVTWDKLYARRRVLLLDTCLSGSQLASAVRGDPVAPLYDQAQANRFVDLTAEGLYIIAASSDDGLAEERDENGLFTRALLDGLDGAADVDGNGFVEIEELKDYASGEVHRRSAGRQRPTVPTVRGGENFPVARVADS